MDDMFFSAASKKPSIQLLSKYVYFCSIKVARDKSVSVFRSANLLFSQPPAPQFASFPQLAGLSIFHVKYTCEYHASLFALVQQAKAALRRMLSQLCLKRKKRLGHYCLLVRNNKEQQIYDTYEQSNVFERFFILERAGRVT